MQHQMITDSVYNNIFIKVIYLESVNGTCKLTRMHVGNQLQHHRPIAGQHLQLVLQYHILEVRQGVLHLSHVVGQILYRLGTAPEQVVPMAGLGTAPISAATAGAVGRVGSAFRVPSLRRR